MKAWSQATVWARATALACACFAFQLPAQPLPEEVIRVPKPVLLGTVELETTVYRPPGDGPFPLAVVNHGKAEDLPRAQPRMRPTSMARYLLERGYAVVVPMRQGFASSSGSYQGAGCNVESNGRMQAEDVAATIAHFSRQAWVDPGRIVVIGQSHGGWTTLAYGAEKPVPGVRALVNFAGGLRQTRCRNWEGALAHAAANYGKQTTLPSLWLYGDNDSYFGPDTFRAMHSAYTRAGAPAKLLAYGSFGVDSHKLFAAEDGRATWEAPLDEFLASAGLPSAVVRPEYARQPSVPVPPASGFASLADADAIPQLSEKGRSGYRSFLEKPAPRAFAISANGAWGWAQGKPDPLRRALDNCSRHAAGSTCRLYAVDSEVVWKP